MSCKCTCCSNNENTYQNIIATVSEAIEEIDAKLVEAYTVLEAAKNAAASKPNDEDINFNPDGELQFADREYNTDLYIGKGWKILRRKYVEACSCGCDCCNGKKLSNVLTQADFSEANTIYVVRYDFDLGGKKITLPVGCELRFEGGSFSNGEIDLNKGKITGTVGDTDDYFHNVNIYNYSDGQTVWQDGVLMIWSEGKWKTVTTITLDDVQYAINKGSGASLPMPSANDGSITLPFKTMTLSEYNNTTPAAGVTYNIID